MSPYKDVLLRVKIRSAIMTTTGVSLILAWGAFLVTLYLQSQLPDSRARINIGLAIVGCTLAASAGIAFVLAARFARLILRPITHLAETVTQVSSRRDFTLRAEKHGDDELGGLIDGFNDMLSQIQVRDGALEFARNELESRVQERTVQLQLVNQEMKSEVAERKRAEDSARESEERYRQVVELSPDAIVIQAEGRLAYVNSAAVALFGATSPEMLVGRPVLDFTPKESREELISRIRRAYEGSRRNRLYEERLARVDGSTVDVEVASILFKHQGKSAVLVILRDITQRKQVERMKAEFVSTVSHELRTPITSIQGSLGLIANGVTGALPPAAKPLVDVAYKNCQRLVLLINDILDVEKIAAGQMRFSFKPLDIGSLLEQTIESNRAYAADFGVTFAFRDDAPDARINADSDRLIQVFTNLLSNAAKFSPRGGTVAVSVSTQNGSLRLEVADRGPGIPEEFRKRIFQKFSQADSTDIRQKGGTGLGLAICKSIVERHGGRIGFDTETGRGTAFWVELPLITDGPAAEAPTPKFSAAHALVCEGDPQIAGFIRLVLSREGFQSDIAATTAEARMKVREKKYDLLTLNLLLPCMDGAAFLEGLRSAPETRALPIIIISAAVGPSGADILRSNASHVVDCLETPIDPPRLRSAARKALQARDAAPAKVLHVEKDVDIRHLVSYTLRIAAETSGAASLAEARGKLEQHAYDLVVANADLPDGAGQELLPLLDRSGGRRTPLVFFNARRGEGGATHALASQLVKSLASEPDLPEPIQSWVRSGIARKPQGATT